MKINNRKFIKGTNPILPYSKSMIIWDLLFLILILWTMEKDGKVLLAQHNHVTAVDIIPEKVYTTDLFQRD